MFDYVKNFLVIIIYAAFCREFSEFKKIFRLLLIIATVLGALALLEFTWAMGNVYVLDKKITDQGIYLFSNIDVSDIITLKDVYWRYGIFRSPNAYGLFILLILTIYFYTEKRVNTIIAFIQIVGIIASNLRRAYAGLIFVVISLLITMRKLTMLFLLFMVIFGITWKYMSNDFSLYSTYRSYLPENEATIDLNDIRTYSRYKSMEIWKDHPVWGVGPGMFGGIVSLKFNSTVYSDYNYKLMGILKKNGTIEDFWFQVLAELGITGSLCFIMFILTLFTVLYYARDRSVDYELNKLFSGLMIFTICVIFFSIGGGINISAVLYTFCAFVGIGLGCLSKQSVD